ncbi:response regulator [Dokdonia donghaensis]|uniref:Response regulatory domain-containing protein n=1 Tax=Dokdonia donghaensis DSW-1 TaxID=1300343 RepID=A0A0A2GW97_9FLAO|nr:response regulator [Dokdonia donghaensis]ANH60258.1 Phosphate regulon transcriptional regulatory protein PhoB [Dokdonia donghaensis DSW-1]KGO07544.1 hypothetical protein NV36_12325 [Dokdonia donghaensis DSW-1]
MSGINTPKILIVEDSENILELLELMVEFQEWKSARLKNLDNFIDHVASIKPDVVLMDMLLSGANGCDACIALKAAEAYRDIPVIMMSAHPEAQRESIDAGADYFIGKPFEMEDMISLLKKAL